MTIHRPVLLSEAVEYLHCRAGAFYVDCTAGTAGHSLAILNATAPDGFLLAFDRDADVLRIAGERLAGFQGRFRLVHGDYRMLTTVLEENSFPQPAGILADLGASRYQFDSPERGFSFQQEGPLDMRMDRTQEETAADIVNTWDERRLADLFREYGEERAAARIARRIVAERQESPIQTTTRLASIVERVRPRRREDKIHPATKTFQALRIAVNHELEGLDTFIFDAFDALSDNGRLVIISFHSLEDRIVKQSFQFLSADCRCPKQFPECRCGGTPLSRLLTRKPVVPQEEEINENPPSRSAKLRAVEKLQSGGRQDARAEFWKEWLRERT